MEKRYQVFVSSTYEDLKQERQEVIQALLELDCIPAGMELFPAADEDQWSLIRKVIDDCDYYIVIVGGRYGSLSPTGISFTQMEYEYAVSQGKPVIGFVHRDPESIPLAKTEKSEEGRKKLDSFRLLVQQKMCKPWSTPDELGSVISRSLVKLINSKPGVGWVRGNLVPEESATQEILKLRKRIDALQAELDNVRTEAPKGIEPLAQGDDPLSMRFSYTTYKTELGGRFNTPQEVADETGAAQITTRWNDVFSVISPTMINEATDRQLESELSKFISVVGMPKLQERHPDKKIRNIQVVNADFDTIKVQLRALGLITRSQRQRSVKDKSTYWTLTPYGDTMMTKFRAVKRTSQVVSDPPIPAIGLVSGNKEQASQPSGH